MINRSDKQGEGGDAKHEGRVARVRKAAAVDERETRGRDDIPQPPQIPVIVYQPFAETESRHLPCCDFVINT